MNLEQPPASYAGRTRYTQLEYEALLANATLGIAFTRERKFFLCNPKFAEMFGYGPEELIGMPGETVYPGPQSYEALGRIAVPILAAGRQLDLEWEMRRKDGSTFLARVIAKALDPQRAQQGTVWICEDITEKRRHADDLERLLREQAAILGTASIGIVFIKERRIVRCNRRYEEMYGYGPGELDGQPISRVYLDPAEYERAAGVYANLARGLTARRQELRRRKDGSTFWIRADGRAVDPHDPHKGSVWIVEDITEQRHAEEELQRLLAEQQALLNNVIVGIQFTRDRVTVRCNRRFEELFGYAPGSAVGASARELYFTEAEYREVAAIVYAELDAGRLHTREHWLRRQDGSGFWCRVSGRALAPGDPSRGYVWLFEDITQEHESAERLRRALDEQETIVAARTRELKEAEERARHLADHDALTGLPNRRLLEDRLTQAIALSHRKRQFTAVMFIDLDRFKAVNDSLGHAMGDRLLCEVASRLTEQLRDGDTICRIGGDEFVVVLPELARVEDAGRVAQKLLAELSRPVALESNRITVTPSIGIALFPDDGRDAETLIRNADAAMYHAKESGRANCQFFTEQMNQAATRRLAIEHDLRAALDEGQLGAHFQPIVEAASGRLWGHEALVRWNHPVRGAVPPSEFIQIAEDTGLILRLGEHMLREACRWLARVGPARGLVVSVNLSARQFRDPRLPDLVAQALAEHRLPASLLQLEITESTAMHAGDATLGTLERLKALGVSVALDDFGTGYSSLLALKRLPVDALKIDRSFVSDMDRDEDDRAIVGAVLALARMLELKAVAEGVETEAQAAFLREAGCDRLQGYLIGAPAASDEALRKAREPAWNEAPSTGVGVVDASDGVKNGETP